MGKLLCLPLPQGPPAIIVFLPIHLPQSDCQDIRAHSLPLGLQMGKLRP